MKSVVEIDKSAKKNSVVSSEEKETAEEMEKENDGGSKNNEKSMRTASNEKVEAMKSSSGKLEAVSGEGGVCEKSSGDKRKVESGSVEISSENQTMDVTEVGRAKETRRRKWDSRGRSESRESNETRGTDNKIKLNRGTLNQGLNQVGEQSVADVADKKTEPDEGSPSDKTDLSVKEPDAKNGDGCGHRSGKVESPPKKITTVDDEKDESHSSEQMETSADKTEGVGADDDKVESAAGKKHESETKETGGDDKAEKSVGKEAETSRESRSKTRYLFLRSWFCYLVM